MFPEKSPREKQSQTSFWAMWLVFLTYWLRHCKMTKGRAGSPLILTHLGSISCNLATFPSPRNTKETRDGLGFQWNRPGKNNHKVAFGQCDWFFWLTNWDTAKRLEDGLGHLWFWPTWALFPTFWATFPSTRNIKVTRDGLGFQRKTIANLLLGSLAGFSDLLIEFQKYYIVVEECKK